MATTLKDMTGTQIKKELDAIDARDTKANFCGTFINRGWGEMRMTEIETRYPDEPETVAWRKFQDTHGARRRALRDEIRRRFNVDYIPHEFMRQRRTWGE